MELAIVDNELKMAQVFDLSKLTSLSVKAVLALTDNVPDSDVKFSLDCTFMVYNPVRVVADEDGDDVIGHAVVYAEKNRLMADLFIVRDCPQRLDIEARSKKFYAVPQFEIMEGEGDSPLTIRKCFCHFIKVQEEMVDDRIPPIGEPVL